MQGMTYGELPKRDLGTGEPQAQMRCAEGCEGIYSADYGDYFWANDEDVVTCAQCGGVMELGRETMVWVEA